jgi:hypothetical protein
MAYDGKSLDEYVDVAERLQDFADATEGKGTVQTISWEVVTLEGEWPKDSRASGSQAKKGDAIKRTYVVYRAAAFRHDADPRPGMGIAWEPWPGITPYTHDSELMNAETAAWGRAIVACGLVANRKLASRQEVRNRMADQESDEETPKAKPKGSKAKPKAEPTWQVPEAEMNELRTLYEKSGWASDADHETLRMQLAAVGAGNAGPIGPCLAALTESQFATVKVSLAEAAAGIVK